MATKKPRRTAERILEVTLELFNRFGEPNVSTGHTISASAGSMASMDRAASDMSTAISATNSPSFMAGRAGLVVMAAFEIRM